MSSARWECARCLKQVRFGGRLLAWLIGAVLNLAVEDIHPDGEQHQVNEAEEYDRHQHLLADDARWTIEGNSVASKTYPTKEDFMREVIRPFNARMQSPLKPVIRNLYADHDTVVVFFDARGIARDGQPYANTYAWFLDMQAGRIIRAFAFFDAIEFNDLWGRVKPVQAH